MAVKTLVIDGVDKFPLEPSLNETNLSDCYDTLEIVYDEVYSFEYFDGQLDQLNHLNNAMLIVNEWHKDVTGAEKNWLPNRDFNFPNQEKSNDSE